MARSPGSPCTNPDHQDGDHGIECMPPADPAWPELRLLRAIYGLCPNCDIEDEHEHECDTCGRDQPLPDGSYCYHSPDLPLYVRPYRAETDRGVVVLVTPTYARAAALLRRGGYRVYRLRSLDAENGKSFPGTWANVRITQELKEQIHDDWLEELGWDG